jgi:hypothetical protein
MDPAEVRNIGENIPRGKCDCNIDHRPETRQSSHLSEQDGVGRRLVKTTEAPKAEHQRAVLAEGQKRKKSCKRRLEPQSRQVISKMPSKTHSMWGSTSTKESKL